jgi:hypothetical protein
LAVSAVALGVASAGGSTFLQEGDGLLSATANGAPAAGVDIFLLVNQGKSALGKTSSVGQLPFDPALLTGKVRVQVAVRECPDRTEVYLVEGETDDACREVEEASEKEEGCRCDLAGLIWWGDRLQLDVTELTATGASAPLTRNPLFWGGLAGAGVATGIVVGTGGSATTTTSAPIGTGSPGTPVSTTTTTAPPTTTTSAAIDLTGTYDINIVGVSDPGGHRQFTGDPPPRIDIRVNGGNFTATGQAPWVRVDGTIDGAGRFRAEGRGTVAGRANVMVTFEGQIEMSSPHRLNGSYRMGAGGELPGGQAIEFRLQGQKR